MLARSKKLEDPGPAKWSGNWTNNPQELENPGPSRRFWRSNHWWKKSPGLRIQKSYEDLQAI